MRIPVPACPVALLALLAALLALPLGTAAPAHAGPDEAAPRATPADVQALVQLVAAYEAAEVARDVELRISLLPGLCRTAADAAWPDSNAEARKAVLAARARVRTFCQRAIYQPRRALILAGLEGYGILAIPGSSQDLKPLARRSESKRRPLEVRLAAIAAWGAVHDPGTHGELLEYVRLPSADREDQTLAISALQALEGYKALALGAQRYELMGTVITLFMRLRDEAGLRTGMTITPVSKDWYEVLEKPFVTLVNALGGQIFVSYGQCVRWWNDNKASIRAGRTPGRPRRPGPARPRRAPRAHGATQRTRSTRALRAGRARGLGPGRGAVRAGRRAA
ncbi:MAG: hypothetical protein ACKOSS_08000 [Planctomycetia bacterium]